MSSPSFTDDEKSQFLQDLIRALGDPTNIGLITETFEQVGTRAVKTEEGFDQFMSTLDKFVQESGAEYAGIIPLQAEWPGLRKNLVDVIAVTRDLAMGTAAEYETYILLFRMFADVQTKEELQDLAAELQQFAKSRSTDIPLDFKRRVMDLNQGVEDVQTRLNQYFDEQKIALPKEIELLLSEINTVMRDILVISKEIKDTITSLGLAPWWDLCGAVSPTPPIPILVARRASKQRELEQKVEGLKTISFQLPGATGLRAQLIALDLDFKYFVGSLGNGYQNEALEFAIIFETAGTPDAVSEIDKLRIKLTIAVSTPLTQALRAFADKCC